MVEFTDSFMVPTSEQSICIEILPTEIIAAILNFVRDPLATYSVCKLWFLLREDNANGMVFMNMVKSLELNRIRFTSLDTTCWTRIGRMSLHPALRSVGNYLMGHSRNDMEHKEAVEQRPEEQPCTSIGHRISNIKQTRVRDRSFTEKKYGHRSTMEDNPFATPRRYSRNFLSKMTPLTALKMATINVPDKWRIDKDFIVFANRHTTAELVGMFGSHEETTKGG
jgi:hypothetical protein